MCQEQYTTNKRNPMNDEYEKNLLNLKRKMRS